MNSKRTPPAGLFYVLAAAVTCLPHAAFAQLPDHPIITEVYTDPVGLNDGPVARDPASDHQEYIEIFLPDQTTLNPSLDKDSLELTFYEVEGDSSSSGLALVNYRFDLPPFDVDLTNGVTAGAVARPTSGIVVLGWIDYSGNPPTALAGTPGTRIALINGGITTVPAAPDDYVFVAINGAHFSGTTTNFETVLAENLIDLPDGFSNKETQSGIVQNGSSAFLLVVRDPAKGYVELCDDKHAIDCTAGADPALPNDMLGLKSTALLDGFASNDDSLFDVTMQPYATPTGNDIDLETVLPLGGAFSLLVPQIPEVISTGTDPGTANGYARLFVDIPKTTETFAPDDPVQDATLAYRHIRNNGPFVPTPGRAVLTNSPPELGVQEVPLAINVIAGTSGQVGVLVANIGGDFDIDIAISPGASDNPTAVTFINGTPALAVPGQSFATPTVTASAALTAPDGAIATAPVTVTATNTNAGDPAVLSPMRSAFVSASVLNPTTGQDAAGLPLETTVFVAVQGIADSPGVTNDFLATDLGQFLAAKPDITLFDSFGNGATLLNPLTNLRDAATATALVREIPANNEMCTNWLDFPGPIGGLNLAQTVAQSAEAVDVGSTTYTGSFVINFNCGTIAVPVLKSTVKARRANLPDCFTFGSTFSPSETLHFVDSDGGIANPNRDFSNVTTTRKFEVALIDTEMRLNGSIENGATDDFGIIVEALDVEVGSPVLPGQFVFLSIAGGLQGADIDTLKLPDDPDDPLLADQRTIANIIYLDLDNLHDVLGIRTIEQVIVVDAAADFGDTSAIDLIEGFALNPIVGGGCVLNSECDDGNFCNGAETCVAGACQPGTPPVCNDNIACTTDFCSEALNACTATPNDALCADPLFCNGAEVCDLNLGCIPGPAPCPDPAAPLCDESADVCRQCFVTADCEDNNECTIDACVAFVCDHTPTNEGLPCAGGLGVCTAGVCVGPCTVDDDCNDQNACTFDQCTASECTNTTNRYGDLDHNNTINIFDLFCMLDAFQDVFSTCSKVNVDIDPCMGNDVINIFDLFSLLDALGGIDACCGG